jgi:hypothetical protein
MARKRIMSMLARGNDHACSDESPRRRLRDRQDERWLESQVREMYQDIVNELVPADILKILNRILKLRELM